MVLFQRASLLVPRDKNDTTEHQQPFHEIERLSILKIFGQKSHITVAVVFSIQVVLLASKIQGA